MPKNVIGKINFLLVAAFVTFILLPNLIFADVHHSGHITVNTTWTAAYNNHIIDDDVTVDPGVALTIEAGCVLKFAPNVGVIVNGTLNANGTGTKRVTFTRNTDEYWAGIDLTNGVGNFQDCIIEYANIGIIDHLDTFTNNNVQNCNTGIKLVGLTALSSGSGNVIASNANAGIYCQECDTITINGFNFENNSGYGAIYADDCQSFTIGSNTMNGNIYPLSMTPGSMPDASSTIPTAGNTNNAIRVTGDDLDSVAVWPRFAGLDYHITDGNLNITNTGSLTLSPGTTLRIWPGLYVNVDGTLNAVGNAGNKVKFTRGDSNYWGGIKALGSGVANLQYCTIEYADIGITDHLDTFSNSTIQNCNTGVMLVNLTSLSSGSGNVIANNANAGMHCQECDGITINGFNFENNSGYGAIYADDCQSFIIGTNTMSGNAYPLSMTPVSMPSATSTIPNTGNTNNAIHITDGEVDSTVTWHRFAGLDYHIIDNDLIIKGSLTISPGTTLRIWPGLYVNVDGTLNAVGTDADRIKFTRGISAYWAGIKVSGSGTTNFQYCTIEFADVGIANHLDTLTNSMIQNCNTGIKLVDIVSLSGISTSQIPLTPFAKGGISDISFDKGGTNETFNSFAKGGTDELGFAKGGINERLVFENSASIRSVSGNVIANNANAGIHCQNCDGIIISSFTFENNGGYGAIYADNCPSFTVGSNTMSGNAYPLSMTPVSMPSATSTIPNTGNTNNAIHITDGDVDSAVTWYRLAGLDYHITDGDLNITNTGLLNLSPGTTLKIWPGLYVNVDGTLNAVGTNIDRIKFTRGISTYWAGIKVSNSGIANLQYCIIEYANNGVLDYLDTFKNNTVQYCTKGVNLKDMDGTFSNNIIQNCDNGIYLQNATPSSLPITNCVIAKNGYGINLYGTDLNIVNCTIVYNTSAGVYCRNPSSAMALNCIIWESIIHLEGSSDMHISYSDVQTGFPGEGNMDADPNFVSVTTGDYHLTTYSPCIGSGTITGDVPNNDIDGNPRPNPPGSKPDMGAYENSMAEAPSITIYTPNGGEKVKGGSGYNITWETTSDLVDHVGLLYSTDGGITYPNTIIAITPDDGIYEWTTPVINLSTVRVKAIAEDASNVQLAFDISDGNFIIDNISPVTTDSLSGTLGKNGWYTSDVTVTLNATDNLSGVKETKYKVNDQSWATYTAPFAVTGSIIRYYSVDNSGNIEAEKQKEIKIDKTAPGIPVVTDDGQCIVNGSQLHATWASTDAESGIGEYQYAIGTTQGGVNIVNWTSTGTSESVTKTGLSLVLGQTYYFSVKAKNKAGLWSSPGNSDGILYQSPAIGVDPASLAFDAIAGLGSSTPMKLNITNTGCGTLEWSITGGDSWLNYTPASGICTDETDEVSFSVDATELSEGTYNTSVSINGIGASNSPIEVPIALKVEEVLAITIYTPNGDEKIKGGSVYNITWDTIGSGISHIKLLYSTDGGTNYPNTIIANTPDNGLYEWTTPLINSYEVRVKAVGEDSNNAQLTSDISDGNFVIDSVAPETKASISGIPGDNGWYTSDVMVTLTATDNLAGVKETKYKLNDQPWATYSGPLALAGSALKYYSVDNAGNTETEEQAEIKIDKTPPSTPVVTDDGDCTTYRNRLHATWTSSDPESDLAEYQYAIGTAPGSTNVVNWTSAGKNLGITKSGLVLTLGQVYYFSVKAKNNAGIESPAGVSDGILCKLPEIGVTFSTLVFGASIGEGNPAPKKLGITNTGCGSYEWAITENIPWLSCEPMSGTCSDEPNEVTLSVDTTGLSAGTYNGTIIINAPSASNSPKQLQVKLEIFPQGYHYTLRPGWNLFSFSANRCYYTGNPPNDQPNCVELVNIAQFGFNTLSDWFNSVLTPANSWQIVIGPNGTMDANLSPELHSLKYMSPCSGYWIKIVGPGNVDMSLNALGFASNCGIDLKKDWNLVGCPINKGYYDKEPHPDIPGVDQWVRVNPPVSAYVFGSIQDNYFMIIGPFGAYNPNLSTEFNSLHFIAPGSAVYIKMKEEATLIYP